MAIVKTSTPSVSIPYFLEFFQSLNSPLITVDTANNKVVIDNNVTITITVGSNVNYSRNFNFSENGSSWVSGQYYPVTIVACVGDNFVYLKITSQNSSTTYTTYLYEKIDSKVYSGHYIGNDINCSIYDITISDWIDNTSYKHKKRLNYPCELGNIDYCKEVLFSSDIKMPIEDNNFIACSTITANQIITFEGKNYYSLGSNLLVEY